MMAVTDIIGFSFFIILPGCLPVLLSLDTVNRFISPTVLFHALPHTHSRGTPPRKLCSPSVVIFRSFKRKSRHVLAVSSRAKVLFFPPCPFSFFLSLFPSHKLKTPSLLVSIWYGCSLHFFGSFVIDRATSYLATLQQKQEWFQGRVGRDTHRRTQTDKHPSPNRIATLNPTAFADKQDSYSLLVKGL